MVPKLQLSFLVLLCPQQIGGFHGSQQQLRPATPMTRSLFRHSRWHPPQRNIVLATPENDESSLVSSEFGKSKSINDLISELGVSFKLRAEENIKNSKQATSRPKKILYALVSTFYFLMFLVYRAYRGFFVLLPAVFRQVYSRLQATVETDLSLDDEKEESLRSASWKTKITVSILAAVVTCSYVIGGTIRVVGKFFGSVGKSGWTRSLDAAAKEAVEHEGRIRRRMSMSQEENTQDDSTVSTEDLSP